MCPPKNSNAAGWFVTQGDALTGVNFSETGSSRSIADALRRRSVEKFDGHLVSIEPSSRNVNMTGRPHIRGTRPRQFGPRS
jgi:hypothetical protein